jgi:hypothetical protein
VTVPALPVGRARVPYVAAAHLTIRSEAPICRHLVTRPTRVVQLPSEGRTSLLAVLGRARRRAAASMPHSPEWEAAASAVDAFEVELDAFDPGLSLRSTASRSSVATTNLDFGPVTLPDSVTIQGAVLGHPDRAQAVRWEIRDLSERAASRQGFMRELERLANRNGFVVEVGAVEGASVTFYVWENLPPVVPA